jgi:hypothetical protein
MYYVIVVLEFDTHFQTFGVTILLKVVNFKFVSPLLCEFRKEVSWIIELFVFFIIDFHIFLGKCKPISCYESLVNAFIK